MTTDTMPTIRLLKFGGLTCSACLAMKKAKTLERFADEFPEVLVKELEVNDEDGEHPKGSKFDENFKISDDYEVESLPTLIFEAKGGGELVRVEGAVSIAMLRKAYETAKAQLAASQKIGWEK